MKNVENNDEFIAKVNANRKLISLRRKVMNARQRWETSVQEHCIGVHKVSGDSTRSPTRKLYVVQSGLWWDKIQTEISNLKLAIAKAGYVGAMKPRTLWLPIAIQNAITIELKIYSAKSVRNVSLSQAKAFAKKAGCELMQNQDQFSIHSQTGRDYALRVESKNGIEVHPFPGWVVCLYRKGTKRPRIRKPTSQHDLSHQQRVKSGSSGVNLNEPICKYKNSALYIKKPVFPNSNIDTIGNNEVEVDEDWD